MIGWWLAGLSAVADSEWWLRLPAVLQPAILAWTVRWALPHLVPGVAPWRRDWLTLLVLLAPANVWNVLITTDTPLIYFSVFSGLAWLRAARDDDLRWYAVAGICLAGAVLSKYFAAILGFAYLVDVIRRRTPRALAGLALAYACTLPALGLMAWWNSRNCWPNYMFNFVNRHEGAGWSATTPLLYGLSLLYLLTPPVLWLVWKELRHRRPASAEFQAVAAPDVNNVPALGVLVVVPFILFAALSLVKTIGLHWLLSFVPFALIWLALRLSPATLDRLGRFFVGFAILHVVVILVIAMLPMETWQKNRKYEGLVLTFARQELAQALAADRGDRQKNWVLAMDGYSNAVTLGYNLRQYVIVFGEASSHARHDDILTDFRQLAGRNILVLRKSAPDLTYYRQFFKEVRVDTFDIRGVRFWEVKGEGFDFSTYRDQVLRKAKTRYYALPRWLPQRGCYFCDRYFPEEQCSR